MFHKHYSSKSQRDQEARSVNNDEHLLQQSPAEIIDEMENIFFSDPSGDIDPDLVDSYLSQLDAVSPLEYPDDTEKQLAEFREKHSLLMQEQFSQNAAPARKNKLRFKRVGIAAAVIFLLSVLGSVVYAINPASSFAQWVNEVFSFGSIDNGSYHSVQEALDANNLSDASIPTWLPARYCLADISVDPASSSTIVTGFYDNIDNAEDTLSISIKSLPPQGKMLYEKNGEQVQTLNIGNITYYVSNNTLRKSILWEDSSYQYSITGLLSDEEISKIINSIK